MAGRSLRASAVIVTTLSAIPVWVAGGCTVMTGALPEPTLSVAATLVTEPPEFDAAMALKILQMRNAEGKARSDDRRGRIFARATQEETDAALMKKLAAVERRLARTP